MSAHHPSPLHARRYGLDCLPGKWSQAVPSKIASPNRQRGISLFIVLIILLLSLILVLGGLVVANLNEAITGNQGDTQRAYGAAQALINDAKLDIRLNGVNCNASDFGQSGTNATMIPTGTSTAPNCVLRFPRNFHDFPNDFNVLQTKAGSSSSCVSAASNPNLVGICFSNGPGDVNFAASNVGPSGTVENTSTGASYYMFTLPLSVALTPTSTASNADYGYTANEGITTVGSTARTLALNDSPQKSRYWIEVSQYTGGNSGAIQNLASQNGTAPLACYPYIFRITAMAYGLKSGTFSVLRTYYVPYADNPSCHSNSGSSTPKCGC
jgi:type IV pilus assembly protein PilX